MIISKKFTSIVLLFRTKQFFSYAVISLLLSSCLTSCDNHPDQQQTAHYTGQPVHRVEVIKVEHKLVSLPLTVSGTLEAVTTIRLYNEESGRITALPYEEGDHVKKGTLLAQLDNELIKIDVAKAKASREQASVDLDRLKKLLPKKISTEEEVAHARTELDLASAEEQRQLTRLDRTSIRAPIDGLVTKRLYEPGDMLTQQSHILSIIDPGSLKLEASLAERWIPLVRENQAATLYIRALGSMPSEARINRIHPTIDPDTHKGIIEILLDPVPEGARVGQFAYAEIELKAKDRLVIPVHTIHVEPEGAYVYRIDEHDDGETGVRKVFIEQGQQFDSMAEILSGLEAGDRIVHRGYLGLRDNKTVQISSPEKQADHINAQ